MLRTCCIALMLLFASACALRDADLIAEHHSVAEALAKRAELVMAKDRPVLVAPFLEVNRLDQYSDFGSMAAEHTGSRLAQLGFTVLEIKLNRDALYTLDGKGGLLLSDELRNLSDSVGAQAVLLGTYAPGEDNVYLSARLVRAKDNVVLSSEDYALPMGPDTRALMSDDDLGGMGGRPNKPWY